MRYKKKTKQATRKSTETAHKNTNIRRNLRIFVVLFVFCIVIWAWVKLHSVNTLPIKQVAIEGNYPRINPQVLKKIISPFVNTGFFDVNIAGLKDKLLQQPWVKAVDIRRVWPGKLLIHITQQKAVANWNNDALLNPEGIVFKPKKVTFPRGLPLFIATDGQQQEILNNYKLMSDMLTSIGLSIKQVDVSPRMSWQIELNNNILLYLGRENVFMRLSRFIAIYPKIFADNKHHALYVDMRYTNGMAVKWRNNS